MKASLDRSILITSNLCIIKIFCEFLKIETFDYIKTKRRKSFEGISCYIQLQNNKSKIDFALKKSKIKKFKFNICNIEEKKMKKANCCFLQRFVTKKSRIRRIVVAAKELLIWKMTMHKKYMIDCKSYYLQKIEWEYDVLKQIIALKSTQRKIKTIIWSTNDSLNEIVERAHLNKLSILTNYRLVVINEETLMKRSIAQSRLSSYEDSITLAINATSSHIFATSLTTIEQFSSIVIASSLSFKKTIFIDQLTTSSTQIQVNSNRLNIILFYHFDYVRFRSSLFLLIDWDFSLITNIVDNVNTILSILFNVATVLSNIIMRIIINVITIFSRQQNINLVSRKIHQFTTTSTQIFTKEVFQHVATLTIYLEYIMRTSISYLLINWMIFSIATSVVNSITTSRNQTMNDLRTCHSN